MYWNLVSSKPCSRINGFYGAWLIGFYGAWLFRGLGEGRIYFCRPPPEENISCCVRIVVGPLQRSDGTIPRESHADELVDLTRAETVDPERGRVEPSVVLAVAISS